MSNTELLKTHLEKQNCPKNDIEDIISLRKTAYGCLMTCVSENTALTNRITELENNISKLKESLHIAIDGLEFYAECKHLQVIAGKTIHFEDSCGDIANETLTKIKGE